MVLDAVFFRDVIASLDHRLTKCIDVEGDCTEQL